MGPPGKRRKEPVTYSKKKKATAAQKQALNLKKDENKDNKAQPSKLAGDTLRKRNPHSAKDASGESTGATTSLNNNGDDVAGASFSTSRSPGLRKFWNTFPLNPKSSNVPSKRTRTFDIIIPKNKKHSSPADDFLDEHEALIDKISGNDFGKADPQLFSSSSKVSSYRRSSKLASETLFSRSAKTVGNFLRSGTKTSTPDPLKGSRAIKMTDFSNNNGRSKKVDKIIGATSKDLSGRGQSPAMKLHSKATPRQQSKTREGKAAGESSNTAQGNLSSYPLATSTPLLDYGSKAMMLERPLRPRTSPGEIRKAISNDLKSASHFNAAPRPHHGRTKQPVNTNIENDPFAETPKVATSVKELADIEAASSAYSFREGDSTTEFEVGRRAEAQATRPEDEFQFSLETKVKSEAIGLQQEGNKPKPLMRMGTFGKSSRPSNAQTSKSQNLEEMQNPATEVPTNIFESPDDQIDTSSSSDFESEDELSREPKMTPLSKRISRRISTGLRIRKSNPRDSYADVDVELDELQSLFHKC